MSNQDRRATLQIHLQGPLLIGGYSSPPGFLNATTAQDSSGVPYIPAAALKGVLREAMTRLLRGLGEPACTVDSPCKEGCEVCRLFGAPGTEAEQVLAGGEVTPGRLGGLMVSDAIAPSSAAQGELKERLQVRFGVGIDRKLRSATSEVLFEREVLDAPGAVLEATVRASDIDDNIWKHFEQSLLLVTGIGNSRSRGLGQIRVDCAKETRPVSAVHRFPEKAPNDGMAQVVIEALEPLVLTPWPSTSSLNDTLPYIPGSALRGALGNAAAGMGDKEAFERCFAQPESCLLFSDAYPCNYETQLPIITPYSCFACKNASLRDHSQGPKGAPKTAPIDGLMLLALEPWLAQQGGQLQRLRCPICGDPMGRAKENWPPHKPKQRVVTRLARDIRTGSALPSMLFSMKQLEAKTKFVGTVGRLSPEALSLLNQLCCSEIRVGRGRSRGQGSIRLRIEPFSYPAKTRTLDRIKRFNESITPWLPLLNRAYPGFKIQGALAVLARTDLAISCSRAPDVLRQEVFGDQAERVKCVAQMQSWGTRSGWNEGKDGRAAGPRDLYPVVKAGSCWLFIHDSRVKPALTHLAQLEIEGLGALRELGLGRILVDHDLLVPRSGKKGAYNGT